ncbi:MAG: hypothetical protein JSV49_03540 [Thermoplasmata archaeon]|nr:MAG: hypothetical protein JSV49_03540 [Thermoplasmata archaeon]
MAIPIYVLDTPAFIVGIPCSLTDKLYTVPGVFLELSRKADKERFEYFQNAGLKVQSPASKYLEEIELKAKTTGDSERLSEVDKSLIALALELNAVLITDDYSIQNLAEEFGISYRTVSEKGITEIIHWELKCKGCARIWNEPHQTCPVCGSALKSSRKKSDK